MAGKINDTDMSDLEKEFELEMEEEPTDEKELEQEFEALAEVEEKPEEEFEGPEEQRADDYAEKFYELSQKQFESELEVDEAVNGLLTEMERDFFFKGLLKKVKKAGKGLLKKGLKLAKGLPAFQAIKGITQLARGDLKGLLGSLAKAGLGAAVSAVPGGAAILPVLKGLGFEATEEEPEANKEAWRNLVEVSREAFDHLAQNLHETADEPTEASKLAGNAFQVALQKVQSRAGGLGPSGKPYRVIRVKKGERVKIVVEGI